MFLGGALPTADLTGVALEPQADAGQDLADAAVQFTAEVLAFVLLDASPFGTPAGGPVRLDSGWVKTTRFRRRSVAGPKLTLAESTLLATVTAVTRPAKRIVALLSVLLIGCLPLLAATLGYECRCTGRTVLVQVNQCDGPHGEWCLKAQVAHSNAAASGHEGHGSPVPGDTEHHTAVQNGSDGLAPPVQVASAVTPMLLAVLPGHELWSPRPSPALVASRELSASRPPPSIEVARTVVFLI